MKTFVTLLLLYLACLSLCDVTENNVTVHAPQDKIWQYLSSVKNFESLNIVAIDVVEHPVENPNKRKFTLTEEIPILHFFRKKVVSECSWDMTPSVLINQTVINDSGLDVNVIVRLQPNGEKTTVTHRITITNGDFIKRTFAVKTSRDIQLSWLQNLNKVFIK
ncbi:ispH [Acrasis kona]|uniref:IspH n=1 Tax=Acrasis kona TaxID=1008807 RepID=A0AAW2Z8A9_9EUKA